MENIIKYMYLVLALVALSLIGLVYIQYHLVDNSIRLKNDQFDTLIQPQLFKLNAIISESPSLRQNLIELSKGRDPVTDHSREEIFQYISDAIDSLISAGGFDISYEFGLVQHELPMQLEDSLIFITSEKYKSEILSSRHRVGLDELEALAHFNVYFPNKDAEIAAQTRESLFLSILFIILLTGCFAFAFYLIHSQKKVSEIKDDFINNLTHEFKTPIFSISLAVKTLKDKNKNRSELNRYLNVIDKENSRLKTQVDKILQIALIDSGKFELDKSEVDVHALIKNVVNRFELILDEKKAVIDLDLNSSNSMLNADLLHLSNIIYNLIDNALKYTEEVPDIHISTRDVEEGIELKIKDTGIGMDRDTLNQVFDKFYRAHTGNVHDVKGFGLGLSYVKKIIEVHKGSIAMDSEPGAGTEITITLPR